ncbi:MAG: DUF4288 domain-containing protein [Planctomycetes bacterium]|nr:DUF4288 domain-containing protein [Planctomycetota bacterium]
MSWYAAHIVMMVQLKGKRQSRFPVWENIVLINAASEEKAFAKAEERGRWEEGDDDGTFLWGGQPATWVFAGVRKITMCVDSDKRPGDGTEVTFNEFELISKEAVRRFVNGDPVALKSHDRFDQPEVHHTPIKKLA